MRMNIQKDWKAKLESAYSFMLKCSKITVCNDYLTMSYKVTYRWVSKVKQFLGQ